MNSTEKTATLLTTTDDPMSLATADIYGILADKGIIVFRQCFNSVEEFMAFVKKHSARLSLDPGRTIDAGGAQLVSSGTDAVGLHCENGNAPIWPDLTWFFCTKAPNLGSQTTVCDGVKLLNSLTERTVDIFNNKKIRYSRTVTGTTWRKIVCYYNPDKSRLDNITFHDLVKIVGNDSNTIMRYNKDTDEVAYSYAVNAIQHSTFSKYASFSNSILGPSFNYEKPVIDFEDGTPIPECVIDEIKVASDRLTFPIGWQTFDVAMIDNRRVMHGREKIIDENRRVYNALSYRL